MRYHTTILALVLLLASSTTAFSSEKPDLSRSLPSDPNEALDALLDEDLDAGAWFNPMGATGRGDHRFDDRLPDISPEGIQRRYEDITSRLRRLRELDIPSLDETRALNAQLLQYELSDAIRRMRYREYRMPINQLNGPHIGLPSFAQRLSLHTDEHREMYITRLGQVPAYLDQTIENMREGLADGFTPPRVTMGQVPSQAAQHADARFLTHPREHAMFHPLADLPEDHPLAQEGEQVIAREIVPAFEKLATFLRDEYVPACRDSIGASELPQGDTYYSVQLGHYTSLVMSPEEVHEVGKSEVARIRAEMFDVIARSDFARKDTLKGDELFDAFTAYLRTDPRFYAKTEQELINTYRIVAKQMDQHMPALFGTLPRLSYGVEEMPEYMQSAGPNAYYMYGSLDNGVAGTFVVNTHRLDQRPTYEKVALCLHEAVPGHHHQHALAREGAEQGVHEWRTTLGYNAFGEGWALYAEKLGLEVGPDPEYGLYGDPYDDFGRLSYEMWRALRLVVDTGIHAFGWERQRAIDYMLANSALSQANIEMEVDRYISWPGQACGYKLGELTITELREHAEMALGENFDIRAFHDMLLIEGSLPLNVLERRALAWIDAQATD
ncbi:MAG: DUF885 domain-containing protein [Planctomycetota bacterium]|jgi:uncharacterized protein (DUF885 family)